eukprot:3445193-Prorocentrum_lima.AAC.1
MLSTRWAATRTAAAGSCERFLLSIHAAVARRTRWSATPMLAVGGVIVQVEAAGCGVGIASVV